MNGLTDFDLGALRWVKAEIDNSLNAAMAQLKGCRGDDTTPLKAALTHLHQVCGALQIVDLQGVYQVGNSLEGLLAEIQDKPALRTQDCLNLALQALRAMQGYLDGLLAGLPNTELALQPVYAALQQQRGAEAAPSDLFYPDLGALAQRATPQLPLDTAALERALRGARTKYQKGLVQYLGHGDVQVGLALMDEALRAVERLASGPAQYTFWWAAVGLIEAIRRDNLPQDIWLKRLLGRLDLQIRRLMEGSRQLAERLYRDVLYYQMQATSPDGRAAEVRTLFALDRYRPAAAAATGAVGEDAVQAALATLREAVAKAKEQWMRLTAGRQDSLAPLNEAVGQIDAAVSGLKSPPIGDLAATVRALVNDLGGSEEAVRNEALQLEMATALLLLQHVADNHATLGHDFGEQASLQAQRLRAAVAGEGALPGSASRPLLDEMTRRAQEKLLLEQVTQEIQTNLHRVEEILDKFFRKREERAGLPLVPSLLKQIQGAFNMLQLETAAELVQAGMERIALITEGDHDCSADELDWIAEAISTLGLYVDGLRDGRDDVVSLRRLLAPSTAIEAAETSVEQDLAASTEQLIEAAGQLSAAGDQEAAREELGKALARVARDADLVGDRALRGQADSAMRLLREGASAEAVQTAVQTLAGVAPAAPPAPAVEQLAAASAREIDDELLRVFLEEAQEVLANMAALLDRLRESPLDHNAFVDIRRGFHTLKGSGRMVGLAAPAETAWEVEQTLNLWLRDERAVNREMIEFLDTAANDFRGWIEELERHGVAHVEAEALVDRARRLRGEAAVTLPPPAAAAAPAPEAPPEQVEIGQLLLPAPLFAIFCDEAAGRLTALRDGLAALRQAAAPAYWDDFTRAAHTLAGIARTTGLTPLAEAAHALESWANDWQDKARPLADAVGEGIGTYLDGLQEMLAAILAHTWPPSPAALGVLTTLTPPAAETGAAASGEECDPQLLAIFLAETEELLPRLGESLRQWHADPASAEAKQSLQRTLHTLKGSARMAGAMALGDSAHAMENRLGELGEVAPTAVWLDSLEVDYDRLAEQVDRLRGPAAPAAEAPSVELAPAVPLAYAAAGTGAAEVRQAFKAKSHLLDKLINEAGEVSITRSRIETALAGYKLAAQELTANVERLRSQLRELEMQAETQMGSRLAGSDERPFDPLEFDRYSRLQELTRLMAESVDDVSTAQQTLLAGITDAEYALLQQARTNRNLQQELMQIRMVRLNSQAERLHRVVRQAAADAGRRARLGIEGGDIELDRIVLDRSIVPFEHLLRNAVAHGIEPEATRRQAGKPEAGDIRIVARQDGSDVVLTLSDDGAGIDLDKVRARAEALGWLKSGEAASRERLESFLFLPGFSTAEAVTTVAGRGIGLDVVRNEIAAIGGRIRLESEPGRGTRFTIRLPSTLALAQVVLIEAGDQVYALPASMVTLVRELPDDDWHAVVAAGRLELEGEFFPLRSLAEMTGQRPKPLEGRYRVVLLLRSGDERVALRVDRLAGNAEVVVKGIGPQLARVAGVAGATVLGDGRVALILNPFALMERAPATAGAMLEEASADERAPRILVVDDSLTVRKITDRLLQREGYRVATAKDGVEAMEALQDEIPAVMLLDIEMPRMDGFEVLRHCRADARLRTLPIVMITSRTADKHRQHALELGADVYMGKPYQEEELLATLARYAHRGR